MSEAVHNRIAMLRAERGISRRQLADAVGVHYQTIGYLERGEYSPSLHLALQIAQYFEVPFEVVFSTVVTVARVKPAAKIYARFIGIAVCIYGGWMLLGNLIVAILEGNQYDEGWVLPLVLVAAAVGIVGAVLYLLRFDGSPRWRTRTWRIVGWSGMILCLLLPTGISFFLLPLAGLAALTLGMKSTPEEASEEVTAASS